MGCTVTTLAKIEGGLGVKNLRNVKTALMSKIILPVLNGEEKHWVNIISLKYGKFDIRSSAPPRSCSWFYKMFCKTTDLL